MNHRLLYLFLLYRTTLIALLPETLDDAAFWEMMVEFSEEAGFFSLENTVSNERSFQSIIPKLQSATKRDGVYLGVGPDQNFTYIIAVSPKIAFIVDMRHQNRLQQLLYKALIELAQNRSEFLSLLFCKPIQDVSENASAEELFLAYSGVQKRFPLFQKHLNLVKKHLRETHGFPLSEEDETGLERALAVFYREGEEVKSHGHAMAVSKMPSYRELQCERDALGVNHSYLSDEEHFRALQNMQRRNGIVPIVGNLAGNRALEKIGLYLIAHNAQLTTCYFSNAEQYLTKPLSNLGFRANLFRLPLDSKALFIRSFFGANHLGEWRGRKTYSTTTLSSLKEVLEGIEQRL